MNRKLVTFFSSYLSFLGLNREFRRPCRLGISALLVTTAFIQYLVSALTNMDTLYGFTLPFSHAALTINIISCMISFLLQDNNVHSLLENIDQHIYIYSDEPNIKLEYSWIEEENNMFSLFFCICSHNILISVCMSISPFVQFALMGKVEVLIYPGWIPWKIDKAAPLVCAYIINFSVIVVCTTWYNLYAIFPLYVTFEFRRQTKRLCAALLNIDKMQFRIQETRVTYRLCQNRKPKLTYNKVPKNKIIECIKHHQMLIQSFKLFQSFWTITFSSLLAISIGTITISMYSLMEMVQLQEIIGVTGILSVTVFGLFINCYIGEEFFKLHKTIEDTIFHEIKWYNEAEEVKKLLNIFHMLVDARPFHLNGLYIFRASYKTFVYVCRTSYSCLHVLNASRK